MSVSQPVLNRPGKDKESSWLPAPNGTFSLYMWVSWAKQTIVDGHGFRQRSREPDLSEKAGASRQQPSPAMSAGAAKATFASGGKASLRCQGFEL